MDKDFFSDWEIILEKQIWSSLHEVYEHAGLSQEETVALDKYSNISSYHLLRFKHLMVTGLQGPSLIRCLAGYLRFFNSPAVQSADGNEPPRRTFIKEMFGDKKTHKVSDHMVKRKLASGAVEKVIAIRSRTWSTMFWDKLAELQILTFFCANGYTVELPARKAKGKQPEFFIQVEGIKVGIEVKNLDADVVLDHIFGDFDSSMEQMRNNAHGIEDENVALPKEYRKIVGMIERQYNAAAQKFSDTTGIIFIYVPWGPGRLGNHLQEWTDTLLESWSGGEDPNIAGLVLVFDDTVHFLENPCNLTLEKELRFAQICLNDIRKTYEHCADHNLRPR